MDPVRPSSGGRSRPLGRRRLLALGAGLGAAALAGCSGGADDPRARSSPRPSPARSGVPEVTSARDLGARGDGRTDDTAALQAALDLGSPTVVVPAGTYRVAGTLEIPAHVGRLVVDDGAVLQQTVDAELLHRGGEVETDGRAAEAASRGDEVLRLTGPTDGLAVGDWVYYHAEEFFDRDKYRPGGLRRVVSLDGPELGLDRPVPRDARGTVLVHRVRLAPALRLEGPGALEHVDPSSTRRNNLRLDFCADPVVEGLEVRQGGASGVLLWSTVGGSVDVDVHDLLDEPRGGHYGYGVEVRAGTRDLLVRGTATRVRHAFTTNGGFTPPLPALVRSGEPEDVHVQMRVRDTSSTGLDTHESGHRITLVPDLASTGLETFGGITVRCADVLVDGGTVGDSGSFSLLVAAAATGAVVRGTRFTGAGSSRALDLQGDVRLEDVTVDGFARNGVFVQEGARLDATGLLVDGGGDAGLGVVARRGRGAVQGEVRGCRIGVAWQQGDGLDTSDVWVHDCDLPSRGGAPFSEQPTAAR